MIVRTHRSRRDLVAPRSAGVVLAGTLLCGALLFPATAIAVPDSDSDGLTDVQETGTYNTNPNVKDTDGDVLSDGVEVDRGLNPLNPDTDGDKLADGEENRLGTNPLVQDTDGDTYLDGFEVDVSNTNPLVANPPPAAEAPPAQVQQPTPTPPKAKDSDGDGISDGEELDRFLNPFLADTDLDGVGDGDELANGTNPRNPLSN